MDENGIKLCLEAVCSKQPYGLLKDRPLSVRVGVTCNGGYKKDGQGTEKLAVIPGGLTCKHETSELTQCLKNFMHEEWRIWMEATDHNSTPRGQMKRPSTSQVCKWVKNLWESVKHKTVKSFK
jgi:hypothetical protein